MKKIQKHEWVLTQQFWHCLKLDWSCGSLNSCDTPAFHRFQARLCPHAWMTLLCRVTRGFLNGNPNDQILVFFFLRQALALPFSDFLLPWTWCRASSANLPEWSPSSTLVPRAPCTLPVSWGPSGLLPWGSPLSCSYHSQGWLFTPCNACKMHWIQVNLSQTRLSLKSGLPGTIALCCLLGAPCDPELFPWFFPCLLWFILNSIGNRFLGQAPTKNNSSDSLLFAY